jgi:hypothetical protein
MNIVAGAARPPLGGTIHVKIVEVLIAVSEAGLLPASFHDYQGRLVTTETEAVMVEIERGIQRTRKRIRQKQLARGSMWLVASRADPLPDRAVVIFVFREQPGHVGRGVPVRIGISVVA